MQNASSDLQGMIEAMGEASSTTTARTVRSSGRPGLALLRGLIQTAESDRTDFEQRSTTTGGPRYDQDWDRSFRRSASMGQRRALRMGW